MKIINFHFNILIELLTLNLLAILQCNYPDQFCDQFLWIITIQNNVNITNGNDTLGNGSIQYPYRTITHAINLIKAHQKNHIPKDFEDTLFKYEILISPGTYNFKNGELFPIIIDSIGNISFYFLDGNTVLEGLKDIKYHKSYLEDNLIIYRSSYFLGESFLTISNMGNGEINFHNCKGSCVSLNGGVINIKRINFKNNINGIAVNRDAWVDINQCVISDNDSSGIIIFDDSYVNVRKCNILNNLYGVYIFNNKCNLNLGQCHDLGSNILMNNIKSGICNKSNSTIYALGNIWNKSSLGNFERDFCDSGCNFGNLGNGFLIYDELFNHPPLFSGTQEIYIMYPQIGAQIATKFPSFKWERIDYKLIFLGVFKNEIFVLNNNILNQSDLIWAWHSGLNDQEIITLDDGQAYQDGNIVSLDLLKLDKNINYYWAVWAWDNVGNNIVASSSQYYFKLK